MKRIILLFSLCLAVTLLVARCNGSKTEIPSDKPSQASGEKRSEAVLDPNASPEAVMHTLFEAARTGETGILSFLLPPEGTGSYDGDCKALCNPGNEWLQEELAHNYISMQQFRELFSNARIVGFPSVEGEHAEVNFVFGANREKSETMNLQRINGKWYLKSF